MLGNLPDEVEGGQIVRDANGNPTGVFVSQISSPLAMIEGQQLDNAIDLLEVVRPPWTDNQREAYLELMTNDGLSKGLTGVHDARVPADDLAFYKRFVCRHFGFDQADRS